jgi:hypothetical protein
MQNLRKIAVYLITKRLKKSLANGWNRSIHHLTGVKIAFFNIE